MIKNQLFKAFNQTVKHGKLILMNAWFTCEIKSNE